ncbi:MAG: SUMF1/EgtB/PvdO family nonheme iron enzyme, partial [Planctomycetes bacterium]|nr:SUMF1/EgtB/PvdO family nonheme iron enzyme [Planctomycetota bacterium]
KGLRSFDSRDSEFFLNLLPGPRDRDGLPECVRFWKALIEETDPSFTFAVGVVDGPSGCGKSSLVKAGILPKLGQNIVSVFIESTPADTEVRLLNSLRRLFPEISQRESLVDVLKGIRDGRWSDRSKKLLIVFDQFEQWLHAGNLKDTAQLVDALRHCDGEHLQCLVMVREDFWTGISRFMQQLEIPLQEQKNSLLVDRFDQFHARHVLEQFGRAYGRLPQAPAPLNAEQEQFLDEAIEQLGEEGRVICVRLALFSDLFRRKLWTTEALKKGGGADGLGVTLLEETFVAKSAPEFQRRHRTAVQKLLAKMLPDAGTDIKGSMQSRDDLILACGYVEKPQAFDELIRILDEQLRMVTPTDPEGDFEIGRTSGSEATALPQYFQFAHDYLVPAIRNWLTSEEASTLRGRVRSQLRELAQAWNDKPEPRRLPTFGEWLRILRFTRNRDWTNAERRMVHATSRRVFGRGISFAVLLLIAIAGGAILWQSLIEDREKLAAANLEARILEAPPQQVVLIRDENPRPSRELSRRLKESLNQSELKPKDHLRLALFLAGTDSQQVEFLSHYLLVATPDEVTAILSLPTEHFTPFVSGYWDILMDSSELPGRRLRAGCALARWSPADARWSTHVDDLVAMLVAESPAHAPQWAESLGPARNLLIDPLRSAFQRRDEPDVALVAATFISLYLHDQCDQLVALAFSAVPRQLPVIINALRHHGAEASAPLKLKLTEICPDRPGIECEKLAKQQANAGLCLLQLGDEAAVWPLLRHSKDSRVRSYLIEWAATTGVSVELLTRRLHIEKDPSVLQALILMIGGFGQDRLPESWHSKGDELLINLHSSNSDSGVHFAVEWLFQRWGKLSRLQTADNFDESTLGDGRNWFVNVHGQELAVLRLRGNPNEEPKRVAVSARKVTAQQFKNRQKEPLESNPASFPMQGITLLDAALYCNWLSNKALIPEKEWAYIEFGEPENRRLRLADNFLNRKGYRLLIATEWREACMAGATTRRPFGETDDLLPCYAWYAANSQGELKINGLLKPNRVGLFDMLGNLAEIVHPDEPADKLQQSSIVRVGGMAFGQAPNPNSINSRQIVISTGNLNFGFRVARTLD